MKTEVTTLYLYTDMKTEAQVSVICQFILAQQLGGAAWRGICTLWAQSHIPRTTFCFPSGLAKRNLEFGNRKYIKLITDKVFLKSYDDDRG